MKANTEWKIKDSLVLGERILRIGGIWPLQRAYLLYRLTLTYVVLHMIMGYWDLTDNIGDIDMMVINMLETVVFTSTAFGLLVIRGSKQLKEVIVAVKKEIANENMYEDIEEKRLYFYYNIVSCRFGKAWAILSMSTMNLMYFRPLLHALTSDLGNGSFPYQLPFRAHIIFDYNSPTLYTLVYVYQLPITYVALCHVAEVSIIVSLVLHLCGKLSVLSYRIRNIETKRAEAFKASIRKTVTGHLELTRLSNILNNTFHLMLLVELMNCGLRLGISLYIVLVNISTEPVVAYNFITYAAVVCGFLFLYSYIGEQLMYESQKIGEAFYDVNWPNVESNDRKALLMCIMNGQKSMTITAGKFFTYSLFGFTAIVKTSMACVSMLRQRM
ncbi:odorant receptor 4-like [Ptiloglossa arizonensis]|uniref:odorant receptor 4-like n=1 Tax=Ptiloglossa arizonensis TaxID=3350558 RepID=UPI003FA11B23